jgi:hypothetical protein
MFKKGFGGTAKLGDLIEIMPLAPDQLQSVRTEHLHWSDVDVAVGDQVRQLEPVNRNELSVSGAAFLFMVASPRT